MVAGGAIAAIAVGFMIHTVFRATEDVQAITAHTATQTWSSDSFPVARPNPYDVPGDPDASMVGIAPRAPRERAAMKRQRVFTDNDLLATRGGAWSTPAPAPVSPVDADDDDSDDDD